LEEASKCNSSRALKQAFALVSIHGHDAGDDEPILYSNAELAALQSLDGEASKSPLTALALKCEMRLQGHADDEMGSTFLRIHICCTIRFRRFQKCNTTYIPQKTSIYLTFHFPTLSRILFKQSGRSIVLSIIQSRPPPYLSQNLRTK
jgi:hypothetical protein